jgi:hypothetical protein
LYGSSSFFKEEHLEYALLDAWIEKAQNIPNCTSLSELFPEDQKLKSIFYKMLKGTKTYTIGTNIGYPSLEEFITINEDKKAKAIYISFASTPLLSAIFNDPIATQIHDLEKAKWNKDHKHHPVSKEELTSLVLKDHSLRVNLASIEDLLNFTAKPLSNRIVVGKDKKTGILTEHSY